MKDFLKRFAITYGLFQLALMPIWIVYGFQVYTTANAVVITTIIIVLALASTEAW